MLAPQVRLELTTLRLTVREFNSFEKLRLTENNSLKLIVCKIVCRRKTAYKIQNIETVSRLFCSR